MLRIPPFSSFADSAPNPDYCKRMGCSGCSTVREALIKHWKNSDAFLKKLDQDFGAVDDGSSASFEHS
jgi:hypothetical protein